MAQITTSQHIYIYICISLSHTFSPMLTSSHALRSICRGGCAYAACIQQEDSCNQWTACHGRVKTNNGEETSCMMPCPEGCFKPLLVYISLNKSFQNWLWKTCPVAHAPYIPRRPQNMNLLVSAWSRRCLKFMNHVLWPLWRKFSMKVNCKRWLLCKPRPSSEEVHVEALVACKFHKAAQVRTLWSRDLGQKAHTTCTKFESWEWGQIGDGTGVIVQRCCLSWEASWR